MPTTQGMISLLGLGSWRGSNEMAERGTAAFYREQAARLTLIAADTQTPESRVELLEMAAVFQQLAEHTVANRNSSSAIDVKSA